MKPRSNICRLIIGLFTGLFSLVNYSNEVDNSQVRLNFEKVNKCYSKGKSFLLENPALKMISYEKLRCDNDVLFYSTVSIKNDSIKPEPNAKDINASEVKKPFFGKIYTYGLPPAKGVGPCKVGVFKTSYFFGIKISGPKPVMRPCEKNEDILTQEVVGCGEEFVPEKEKEKILKEEKKEKARANDRKNRKQDDFLDDF